MTNNKVTQALRAREGGAVRRCHTIPWTGSYDVAQHTFNMLTLLDILYPSQRVYCDLIQHILFHDVHERWTGDVPAGLRYFHPDVRKNFKLAEKEVNERFKFPVCDLGIDGIRWVRALDQLEFYMACHDQLALGNRNVDPYLKSVAEWFRDTPADEIPEPVATFFKEFRWERTTQRLSRSSTLDPTLTACHGCRRLHPKRQDRPPFICEACEAEDKTYE